MSLPPGGHCHPALRDRLHYPGVVYDRHGAEQGRSASLRALAALAEGHEDGATVAAGGMMYWFAAGAPPRLLGSLN